MNTTIQDFDRFQAVAVFTAELDEAFEIRRLEYAPYKTASIAFGIIEQRWFEHLREKSIIEFGWFLDSVSDEDLKTYAATRPEMDLDALLSRFCSVFVKRVMERHVDGGY